MSRMVRSDNDTWEVLRELGRGGMGRTMLVRSATTGQQAVLKELHLAHLDDWKALEMFRREAALLAALDHPGVPRTLGVIDEGDGTQALLQSFVDGQTLQKIIDEGAPLAPERFEAALRQCLDILEYLHGRVPSVVHRDITPRNVMLGPQRAFVIDFGSVKWALRESTQMTSVGTFGYMPPEQVLGRAEPASDLYALGMTFVALATRLDPSRFEVDPQTGRVDVRGMLRLEPRIADVLDRMTRPGLGERLTDARQALRLLDGVASRQPARAAAPLDSPGQAVAAPTKGGGRTALVVGVAVLVTGATLAALMSSSAQTIVLQSEQAPAATPVDVSATAEPAIPAGLLPHVPATTVEPSEVVAGTAKIRLDSRPGGVEVRLPGDRVCVTPCQVEVPYGRQLFRFTHDGRTITRDLMVIEDTSLLVAF